MRLKLLFSESVRSLGANLSTTIAATMTVLIGMFLLGLFIALGSWAQAFGDNQKEKLLIKVYFCTESTCAKPATQDQINAVRVKLASDPLVKSIDFVPKAEALERMRKLQPEIVENLPGNPLPDAFEVAAHDGCDVQAISRNLRRRRSRPGVEKINDGGEVSDRVVTGRACPLDCVCDRDRHPPDLVGAPDREHDPALDLLAPSGDRGDEARRSDELVRPRAVHARGPDLRLCSARFAAVLLLIDRQGRRARADHQPVRRRVPASKGLVVPDHRP
jgi:hypothetical protein